MWISISWLPLVAVHWTVTFEDDACTYYRGAVESDGVMPVRVDCDWAVDSGKAAQLLEDQNAHDEIFDALAESTILSEEGPIRRVYQVQRAAGVTDRHVILEYTEEMLSNGRRFRWTKSTDQSALRSEGVEVEVTEGQWEVTKTETGMHLHYELRYLPGGRVPPFLVSWFQGLGTRLVIADLRESLVPYEIP